MQTSESINELAAALSKAQGALTGAKKDSSNPFFKSHYADLESVWEACRKALSANGLSVVQTVSDESQHIDVPPRLAESGRVVVTTMLAHSSGQWIRDSAAYTPKDEGPQAMGSCITYGRRYGLAAIVGVYQTDDDGEAASGRKSDAKGDLGKGIDPKQAAGIADEFRTAFDLDTEETDKAAAVFRVHERIATDADLYTAVGEQLTTKERSAIHTYVAAHRKATASAHVNGRGR